MGYDAMGDITSQSDVAGGATWTYDPVRKHAVTQAGSSSFTYAYDANGNATSRNGSTITWTSYNYPSGVTTATETATFDYGPDRQRWRMIYTGASGTETTYYATPLFEAVYTSSGTDFRHYIPTPGGTVVQMHRSTGGAVSVRSLLTDHQGSIFSIVSAQGTNFQTESFTAYGNPRESSTWSGSPTSTELANMDGITREGYTFQTVLGTMGLNHMNGRIEDSITGRFLSPDPRGTIRGNTQSWNRYSYVNNNPLTYIDPSGFDECDHNHPSLGGDGCGGAAGPGSSGGGGGGGSSGGGDSGGTGNFTCDMNGQCTEVQSVGNKNGTGASDFSFETPFTVPVAPPFWTKFGLSAPGQAQSQTHTQCIKQDGTIQNDSPNSSSVSNGNVRFASLNIEGYMGFGFTEQLGIFKDTTTGNWGFYNTFGLGGGWGGSASINGGKARSLSSFQGLTGQLEGGIGPIAATYTASADDPFSPIALSGGLGWNMMPVPPLPAAGNVSRTNTTIFGSTLPTCPVP
jgi:RHS repeat-associated protein